MKKLRWGGGLNRLDKNYPLFIHKLGYKFFACLATLVFILSTILLAFPELTNHKVTDAFTTSNIGDAATVGEIWNGSAFDENNLNTLLKYVSGSDSISTKDLSYLYNNEKINEKEGITGKTAADMRASTAAGKEEGKDIVVTFGGLKWTPTYLSKTKPNEKNENGDLILTLWLADSAQLSGGTYDEGASKKFDTSGTATWNAGGGHADKPTDNYPDAMYGTSYMNAVVLNNGGYYKPNYSVDEVTKVEKNPNHVFAKFTTDEKLTKYITTPSEVAWQEYGQDKRLTSSYTLPNENWSETINKDGKIDGDPTETSYNFSDYYNYASKEWSNQWKNSTLWLPSMSETGYSDSEVGIWQTSTAQRSNTTDSWLRSGYYYTASHAYYLTSAGSDNRAYIVNYSYAVRPSLHLNLTEAAKNAKQPTLADTTTDAPSDPDLYKIVKDNGIDFHIKTAEGFLKLSEATAAGSAFDPSWTFYLDNDITLNLDNTYVPIGDRDNPFTGTFDGQGCTLNFNLISDNEYGSIFGTISDSNFINLNINYNVNLTGEENYFYGLCVNEAENTTCNLSHINITGKIITSAVGLSIGFFSNGDNNTFQNLYDVNVNLDSVEAQAVEVAGGFNINIDSCSFIYQQTTAIQFAALEYRGQTTVSNSQFVVNAPNCMACLLFGPVNLGDLTIIETSFNLSLSDNVMGVGLSVGMVEEEEVHCPKITLFDVSINCSSFTNIILIGGDDMSGITDYPEGYYYSGVYIHDSRSATTTILDSNFTSYKWCADPHFNGGLPQLRRFVSIGDFMEQCNMASWVDSLK